MHKPTRIFYAGGPLDGHTQQKTTPGRAQRYRNSEGAPVATLRMAKYWVSGCGCNAFTLYGLQEKDGRNLRYRWLDEHNPANHT